MIILLIVGIYFIGALVAKAVSICYERSPYYNQWLSFITEDACIALWPIFWTLGPIMLVVGTVFRFLANQLANIFCPNKE